MGRMRKIKTGTYDRIGEKVNLDKCPQCGWYSDCFACMDGYCTALSEVMGDRCSFYKSYDDAKAEVIQSYQRLKAAQRYDLIQKYIKQLTALGALDGEILELAQKGLEIDKALLMEFHVLNELAPIASPNQVEP